MYRTPRRGMPILLFRTSNMVPAAPSALVLTAYTPCMLVVVDTSFP